MLAAKIIHMEATKRITANLPTELLDDAVKATKKGITDTLIYGLTLVRQTKAYDKGMKLKGKLKIKLDLDKLRERPRR